MATRQKGMTIYRHMNNAYDEIRIEDKESKENFFVSYAVRGPSYVNDYGGVQYDMPLKCPMKNGSTVIEPSPLNTESRCNTFSENHIEGVM
jgi:hypothetical protein